MINPQSLPILKLALPALLLMASACTHPTLFDEDGFSGRIQSRENLDAGFIRLSLQADVRECDGDVRVSAGPATEVADRNNRLTTLEALQPGLKIRVYLAPTVIDGVCPAGTGARLIRIVG